MSDRYQEEDAEAELELSLEQAREAAGSSGPFIHLGGEARTLAEMRTAYLECRDELAAEMLRSAELRLEHKDFRGSWCLLLGGDPNCHEPETGLFAMEDSAIVKVVTETMDAVTAERDEIGLQLDAARKNNAALLEAVGVATDALAQLKADGAEILVAFGALKAEVLATIRNTPHASHDDEYFRGCHACQAEDPDAYALAFELPTGEV